MALTGVAALEEWCRRALDGSGVEVSNMSTAWRDGMAFCAIIHRYRPDLLDLQALDPKDYRGNCSLAFRLAAEELGVPPLLDVEDIVDTRSPDRFSILTYLAQFYHRLSNPDSGISSLSQSPIGSDTETEPGRGGSIAALQDRVHGRLVRSSSTNRRRGAIHSLMDGRRVRSLSCGAGIGRRGRVGRSDSSPPIQSENPFRTMVNEKAADVKPHPQPDRKHPAADRQKPAVNGSKSTRKPTAGSKPLASGTKPPLSSSNPAAGSKPRKVAPAEPKPLRTTKSNHETTKKAAVTTNVGNKKVPAESNSSLGHSKPSTQAVQKLHYPKTAVSPKPENEQQRSNDGQYCNGESNTGDITTVIPQTRTVEVPRKVNLREKKRGRVGPGVERMTKSLILETDLSDLGSEPDLVGGVRSGSILSFTSVPSPYRRHEDGGDGSTTAGGSRMTILSQCSYRGSSPPPPKPQRTYTHQLKHQLSCPAPATQHQLSCPAGSPTLPSTLKDKMTHSSDGVDTASRRSPVITRDEAELLDRLGRATEVRSLIHNTSTNNTVKRSSVNDSNNNNLMVKARFTNYRQSRQETLRNIVNLRLNATDILKRFGRGAETGKGKLTRKVSESAAGQPQNLPYLQTLV